LEHLELKEETTILKMQCFKHLLDGTF